MCDRVSLLSHWYSGYNMDVIRRQVTWSDLTLSVMHNDFWRSAMNIATYYSVVPVLCMFRSMHTFSTIRIRIDHLCFVDVQTVLLFFNFNTQNINRVIRGQYIQIAIFKELTYTVYVYHACVYVRGAGVSICGCL